VTIHQVSVEEEIADPRKVRPHLVLIGAGASRAAFPHGERSGRRLPLMTDFFDILPIGEILDQTDILWRGNNFEDVYSLLIACADLSAVREQLERTVDEYFRSLSLPVEATLYDVLLLSLRDKDVIATFNWDPFLIQAFQRSATLTRNLPHLLFLHGNVLHGVCTEDGVSGVRGARCSKCGRPFSPDRLLFPVGKKDYSTDPSIAMAWDGMRKTLEDALFFTIFGYGAPTSDQDAVALMSNAWGRWQDRQFEQVEIIDIRPPDELHEAWSGFIHTHHYECHTRFKESFLFNHPRRSVEAFHNQFIEAKFIANNPVPLKLDLPQLHDWFRPLIEADEAVAVKGGA